MSRFSSSLLFGVGTSLTIGAALVAPAFAQTTPLKLVLPEVATVNLSNGRSLRAKLIEMNAQSQQLSVQSPSGRSRPVALSQVRSIQFSPDAPAYRADGRRVIRGGGSSRPVTTTMQAGLQDFTVRQGQAEVNLSQEDYGGELVVAQKANYVVDEIQFNLSQRRVVIKATAY